MGLIIDFHQFSHGEVGISLGGRETHMAQHLLNLSKVCPCIQEMGRKGMTKAVRADLPKDT